MPHCAYFGDITERIIRRVLFPFRAIAVLSWQVHLFVYLTVCDVEALWSYGLGYFENTCTVITRIARLGSSLSVAPSIISLIQGEGFIFQAE